MLWQLLGWWLGGRFILSHGRMTQECYSYLNASATANDGLFIISDGDVCTNSTITCLEEYYINNFNDTSYDSFDCNILCTVENSCSNTVLECPSYLSNNSNCNIHCIEAGSCNNAVIKSNNNNINVNVDCDEYQACDGMTAQLNDINDVKIECNQVSKCSK